MIIDIRARFRCDECGMTFSVEIDPGYSPPDDWDVFEIAEDAVRGSRYYRNDADKPGGSSSVQDGKHLCEECTRVFDTRSVIR